MTRVISRKAGFSPLFASQNMEDLHSRFYDNQEESIVEDIHKVILRAGKFDAAISITVHSTLPDS